MILHRFLVATATTLALAPAVHAADSEFMVLDWAGFDIDGLLTGYVEKNGDRPTYTFFGDDDEAFQKVASGFKTDVTHPCVSILPRYKAAGLVEPWDVSKIPEFANIDPQFLNSTAVKDDQGVWFIPTDWGATAIAYNKDKVPPEDVQSLSVFTDPKYQGRISLPENNDDVWSLAFLATGVTDWQNVTDAQFTAAEDWLRLAHANVRSYWADPGELAQLMASGEVLVSWSWPDPVTLLKKDNFPVGFTRDVKEGTTAWYCGYVNMKDQPGNEDKAYDFMNSWLRPESAAPLLDAIGYGHSSTAAQAAIGIDAMNAAGLGEVATPVLFQYPVSQEMRDKMLSEFEKIKAGF